MNNKGLTASFIFEAFGANYGENVGNFTMLKKITREGGGMYSYISRQALRYNIIQQLGWDNTPVEEMGETKKVVQFAPSARIDEYPEIDLFGYMKTQKNSNAFTRSAVVRLSHALALESYNGDTDYLTNMGQSKRIGAANEISQSEIHRSFYAYTITIDLDLVGIEKNLSGNVGIDIGKEEKIKRVQQLLSAIQYLYRDVKGRRENLSPVFAIGGVYERKTPFFDGRLSIYKGSLEIEKFKNILQSDSTISKNTLIGYVDGFFKNAGKIKEDKELAVKSMTDFFKELSRKVEEYYNESR
jgi:CRISPR-associated protein Cst2